MNDNVIMLPTAKTYLYHNPQKIGAEVIEFVYDNGLNKMNKKQKALLNKRLKIADQILKALPLDKRTLFNDYIELQLEDTSICIDRAIKWTIENESKINDIMAGF